MKQMKLLDLEIETLKKNQSVSGVLLNGSLSYGKATEYSDIDLIVLSDKNEFVSRRVDGILIEEHFHTYERIVDGLNQKPSDVYKYLHSKIIFDDGRLFEIKNKAQGLYERYETPAEEKRRIDYWLSSVKDKLNGAISNNDLLKASYIVSTNSWEVLKGIWAVNNKPMPPSSIAFAFHDSLSVAPFDNWFNSLFEGKTESRVKSIIEIIDWVLCN